jgi:hypothetical protein
MLSEVHPLAALVFLHFCHSFAATGYSLARMFDNAFKRATELAAMFEANPFAAGQVFAREVQFATSLPILQASPEHRAFILAMSAWVGALQACRCGYWEVVEPLVQGACRMAADTRGLWRLSQSFMMFLLQLVPALKEPTAERVAVVSSGISLTKELHGDEETHWQTLLGECGAGNVPAYLYSPAEQQCDSPCCSRAPSPFLRPFPSFCLHRLRVVPISSVIPSATSKKLSIKDFFSGQVVRGQEEWLPVPQDSPSLAVSGHAPSLLNPRAAPNLTPRPCLHSSRLCAAMLCLTPRSVGCNYVGVSLPLLALV